MSVYQLRTFADLYTAVREEIQVQSTDTTAINRIKRDINIVLEEVIAKKRWFWLTGSVDLTIPAYVNAGTVSVTQNSNVATLTVAPTSSKKGYYFGLDGYNEIYRIDSHSANTVTLKLQTNFTGSTQATASYKIWTDRIPLPTDCKETSEAWHDTYRQPLENVGRQEYRRIVSLLSRNEGAPLYYTTGDYVDPAQTSAIASLPAIVSRASAGTVKTIVFASALPSSVLTSIAAGEPVRWVVTGAGQASYNGDINVASVGTTSVANDTITYIGQMEYTESATSDASMAISQLDQEIDYQRYREFFYYPFLNSQNLTVHVDYYKDVLPLSNDSDEPLIPIEDRVVLLYGTLERTWSRMRNPQEAARNSAKYESKLKQMESKWQDSTESARLLPSKRYLGAKRNQWRQRAIDGDFGPLTAGGGSGAQVATGSANSAAQFGPDGVLIASPTVSTTELGYLDGATSNVQAQINLKAPIASPTFTGTVTAPAFSGPLTGAVTGNVTGNLTGNVTGNLTGNADTVTTNANLTGDVTSVGNATTLTNAPVIAKVLTGYTSGAGTVSATDSILQAIQKLNGNDATNANLTGDVTSVGNATTYNNAVPAAKGGTGATAASSAPAASANVLWDANSNLSANNLIDGFTTTALAGSTTTMTIASTYTQVWTGSGTTAQTVKLPTTGVAQGVSYLIQNTTTGSGAITVQSSGANTISTIAAGYQGVFTALVATPTTAANWGYSLSTVNNATPPTGTVTSVTFTGDGTVLSSTPSSAVTTSGTVTAALATATKNTYLGGPLSGSAAAPTYKAFTPPSVQSSTATGTQTGWLFTVTGWTGTTAVGDTYTNNSNTYTVQIAQTNGTGQTLFMSGTGATSGTTLTKGVSASGPATITFSAKLATALYTAPTSPAPLYLRVRMAGGGGGGAASGGTTGTAATDGTDTFFSTSVAAHGVHAAFGANVTGGAGGSPTIGAGCTDTGASTIGADGAGCSDWTVVAAQTASTNGAMGGSSFFGGAGAGGGDRLAGGAAKANSGSGGGGGGGVASASTTYTAGGGGGSGGYAEFFVFAPTTTYPYIVGSGGTGGVAGTSPTGFAGGNGAAGKIIVEEYYQ